jgi:hypothetical protein
MIKEMNSTTNLWPRSQIRFVANELRYQQVSSTRRVTRKYTTNCSRRKCMATSFNADMYDRMYACIFFNMVYCLLHYIHCNCNTTSLILCMHVCMYVTLCVCICVCICVYIMYLCVYVFRYICMYICMYVCTMYIYI